MQRTVKCESSWEPLWSSIEKSLCVEKILEGLCYFMVVEWGRYGRPIIDRYQKNVIGYFSNKLHFISDFIFNDTCILLIFILWPFSHNWLILYTIHTENIINSGKGWHTYSFNTKDLVKKMFIIYFGLVLTNTKKWRQRLIKLIKEENIEIYLINYQYLKSHWMLK